MIDIPMQKIKDMPCYDQNIACYAMSLGRRYEMLFAGSWGFEYREGASEDMVGERIKSRAILNMNYLKRYHGIDVFRSEAGKDDDLIEILERETNRKNPVMVFISCYYYSWNEHYKKFENHIPHAIMVVGVDREKQCIYCLDNMYGQKDSEISFEDFLAGNNGKYWIFSSLPEYTEEVDIEEMVQYCLRKLRRNTNEWKDIEDIRRLGIAMKEDFDLEKEINDLHGGIWVEPIIFNISGILADRLDFARLLSYILEQNKDANLIQVKEHMDKAADSWNQIRGMLIKGHYMEHTDELMKRIIRRVEMVADLEEETAVLLGNWKEKREHENLRQSTEKMPGKEYASIQSIPVEAYFNNQCFGVYQDKKSIRGISGMKHFYFVNDKAKERQWKLRTMEFSHEPVSGKGKDSIMCNGQVIKTDCGIHDCILLMGYGDLCFFEEEIEVQYQDGTCEAIAVQIPDSTLPNPFAEETMIWSGRCGLIDDIEEHTWEVGIYAMAYEIQKKAVENIKLPVCPNVIILAMSFGNYKQ